MGRFSRGCWRCLRLPACEARLARWAHTLPGAFQQRGGAPAPRAAPALRDSSFSFGQKNPASGFERTSCVGKKLE